MNKKNNLTTKETFDLAYQNHQKNNFQVAENYYRKILKADPKHFESTYLLGTLLLQTNKFKMAKEMLENAGFRDVKGFDREYGFGLGIHEMGTARMGIDPKTSMLNRFNQIHSVPNVYVTDGAAMTSSGNQNPSLTYMALTARAANHAVNELKKMNL